MRSQPPEAPIPSSPGAKPEIEILLYCFPVLFLFILQEGLPFVAADVHEPAGDHKTSHPTPLFKREVGGEGVEREGRGERKDTKGREGERAGLVT